MNDDKQNMKVSANKVLLDAAEQLKEAADNQKATVEELKDLSAVMEAGLKEESSTQNE